MASDHLHALQPIFGRRMLRHHQSSLLSRRSPPDRPSLYGPVLACRGVLPRLHNPILAFRRMPLLSRFTILSQLANGIAPLQGSYRSADAGPCKRANFAQNALTNCCNTASESFVTKPKHISSWHA